MSHFAIGSNMRLHLLIPLFQVGISICVANGAGRSGELNEISDDASRALTATTHDKGSTEQFYVGRALTQTDSHVASLDRIVASRAFPTAVLDDPTITSRALTTANHIEVGTGTLNVRSALTRTESHDSSVTRISASRALPAVAGGAPIVGRAGNLRALSVTPHVPQTLNFKLVSQLENAVTVPEHLPITAPDAITHLNGEGRGKAILAMKMWIADLHPQTNFREVKELIHKAHADSSVKRLLYKHVSDAELNAKMFPETLLAESSVDATLIVKSLALLQQIRSEPLIKNPVISLQKLKVLSPEVLDSFASFQTTMGGKSHALRIQAKLFDFLKSEEKMNADMFRDSANKAIERGGDVDSKYYDAVYEVFKIKYAS